MPGPHVASRAIQLVPPGAGLARLLELRATLFRRENELDARRIELQQLQDRYLSEIGPLYRELIGIENDLIELEIKAGLRPAPEPSDQEAESRGDEDLDGPCGAHGAMPDALKRAFRDVARTIHPDLAMDEPSRLRRHSLMAEANRAYAERDADRLRLILHRWEHSVDEAGDIEPGDGPDAVRRKIAAVEVRLAEIDLEFADLDRSAIAGLQDRISETRRQGWDLFAGMIAQLQSDIRRATSRLAAARRMVGIRGRN